LLARRGADDGEDLVDFGVEETFAQNALADHTGSAEKDYVHVFMLQRTLVSYGKFAALKNLDRAQARRWDR